MTRCGRSGEGLIVDFFPAGEFMQPPAAKEITQLLVAWGKGDQTALAQLMPAVYQELRKIADRYLRRERPGHTLQPTALIHEAYLRLIDQSLPHWQNRAHFYGVAAQLMRQILVEHARSLAAQKRGGGARQLALDDALHYVPEGAAELVELDDALRALAEFDERKSRLIELRYFGGLSVEETAYVMGVSPSTITREQRLAQAWLRHTLRKA
jgi:RNA polymerase sigma factor (TIGR02999 family)